MPEDEFNNALRDPTKLKLLRHDVMLLKNGITFVSTFDGYWLLFKHLAKSYFYENQDDFFDVLQVCSVLATYVKQFGASIPDRLADLAKHRTGEYRQDTKICTAIVELLVDIVKALFDSDLAKRTNDICDHGGDLKAIGKKYNYKKYLDPTDETIQGQYMRDSCRFLRERNDKRKENIAACIREEHGGGGPEVWKQIKMEIVNGG